MAVYAFTNKEGVGKPCFPCFFSSPTVTDIFLTEGGMVESPLNTPLGERKLKLSGF